MSPKAFTPRLAVGGAGSLPHTDPFEAVEFVRQTTPRLPAWPQLPARSRDELMLAQVLGHLPLMRPIDDAHTRYQWRRGFDPLELDKISGALSADSAAGFGAFLDAVDLFGEAKVLRGQVPGPVTVAGAIEREGGAPVMGAPEYSMALARYAGRTGAWQAKQLVARANGRPLLITLDEPALSGLLVRGAQSRAARDEIEAMLTLAAEAVREAGALVGLHCCSDTHWPTVLGLGFDVVNFDATNHLSSFMEHETSVEQFIQKGGIIGWGAVPTDGQCDPDSAARILFDVVAGVFGPRTRQVFQNSFITPACGLGTLDIATAALVMGQCQQVADMLRRQMGPSFETTAEGTEPEAEPIAPEKTEERAPGRLRITRVYTKTGDNGQTGLVGGERVAKNHPRIEAYGTVDELGATLGAARLAIAAEKQQFESPSQATLLDAHLQHIQNQLFTLGGDLATRMENRHPKMPVIGEVEATYLEHVCDAFNAELKPLEDFILAGGSATAVALHQARTIARRAERLAVTLAETEEIGPHPAMYLNRLSDALFVLARWANKHQSAEESIWRRGLPAPPMPNESNNT